jgi:hypothetical protein
LFRYYDSKNNTRLKKLETKASITKDLTHSLKELGSSLLSVLKKINSNGKTLGKAKWDKQHPRLPDTVENGVIIKGKLKVSLSDAVYEENGTYFELEAFGKEANNNE